jgi:VanZ family protein
MVGLCVYWPGIFIISHIPKGYMPQNVRVSGVSVHLLAYFVLTLLVFLSAGLGYNTYLRSKKTWLLVGVIAAYATLDEYVQIFIKSRYGSPFDIAIDMSACLLCVGLLRLLAGIRGGRGQLSK